MKSFNPSADDLKASSRDERIRKVTPYAFSNKASSYHSFSKKEKYLEGNGRYCHSFCYKIKNRGIIKI